TGLGTIPGVVAILHGGDVCTAGFRTLFTGENHESYFDQGSNYLLQKAGMSETQARVTTGIFDIGLGMYGAGGSTAALKRSAGLSKTKKLVERISESGESTDDDLAPFSPPRSNVQPTRAAVNAARNVTALREAPATIEENFKTIGGLRR